MKVLTAAQMREVDQLTIKRGIPGLILMENAAHRVVEYLERRFAPLSQQKIVVFCGKGNNGGDGLAIARLLHVRFRPKSLDIVLAAPADQLQGDAAANLQMLRAAGLEVGCELRETMQQATLLVDALLGTGLQGPAKGRAAELIQAINSGFPNAKVVAVDVPSGMASDDVDNEGPCARADATITFTAPKICHALPPNCDRVGELIVAPIGTPAELLEQNPALTLSLVEPAWLAPLFAPRPRGFHKGDCGHVLVVAGSLGKTGAAAMTGLAALRAGAGLVTVASTPPATGEIASHAPELMTEPLAGTDTGAISLHAYGAFEHLLEGKDVLAVGPGLGRHPETVEFVRTLYQRLRLPAIVDADGLNALAGMNVRAGGPRIFTPHPGEMARLCQRSATEIQQDRLSVARTFAQEHGLTLVLKGQRTLIAFADGRVWINPTGTPALATAGSGDILTGFMAGIIAQHPQQMEKAVAAAVWLHGRAGELGAEALGEPALIATDLLRFLPEAMSELRNLSVAQ
ncbi:MAG: NAD(P)H-hydrate dehydratase [Bryobacteraceae bacterium]|nr:NAD(P)H-hydrate dehydratase [Bryobacteraceae bacterium]MDW8378282.1 NAD(P)H-hydrate dehydratase [Bryobacterales bacterium]